MSLSVVQRSDDNYRRDSFKDRVCDDLCEVLLQFLPIEDKLKFECISKQFQRNVFQRQYHLNVTSIMNGRKTSSFPQVIEKLMKKLPNIKSFEYNKRLEAIDDSDIDIIVKHFHKLTKIDMNCDWSQISAEKRESFAAKYGEKLVSITTGKVDFEWFREAFPKLSELNLRGFAVNGQQLSTIRLNNLKKLKIPLSDSYISETPPEIFETNFKQFIENNKRLTHLKIYLFPKNQNILNTAFKHMTKLDQLVYLNIGGFGDNQDINTTINGLRQMSDKCLKIKSLLNVNNPIKTSALFLSFMTEVKKFKALERLEFGLRLQKNSELNQFMENFNGLQSLTHLSINFWNKNPIQMDLIKDIDKSFPKLRVLRIISNYYPIEVSQQSIDSLGRLSRLESLEINVNNESIRHIIIDKIEKNCKKIKSIDIPINVDLLSS